MRPTRGEAHFLPYETPTGKTAVQELLEGKQIALVVWNPQPLPYGVSAMGLELTTSEVMIVMALPVDAGPYACRLAFRFITKQRIWTPRMDKRARHGRVVIPGEGSADPIQRQIEGEVIRGVTAIREPNVSGGEQCLIELANGAALHLNALPDARAPKRRPAAELDVQVEAAAKKLLFLPASRS
jgi:hypothetical protein